MKLNDTELKVLIYIIQNEHEGIYRVDFKSIYSSMNKCKSRVRQIVLKLQHMEYPTKQHKNIQTTFFMSKIWLACQLRGSIQDKPLRTNIICDELFQAPTALNMLTYVLPQSRKFGCKLILSSQYLSQLKGLHTVLEACGASVMLMKGVSELDWKFYSSKIEGFEYDDLVNMPAYHSINLIYTHTGKFYNFLTQLPKPV